MPAPAPPLTLDDYLTRVNNETNKAACYRAAALAFRFVPDLQRHWDGSPTLTAFQFLRQGTHMAFLVTLAALLENTKKSDIVNLRRLMGRLDDTSVRREVASRRGVEPAEVFKRFEKIQKHFSKRLAPLVPRIELVRNNVVAHHGRATEWPETTIGLLNHAMGRVVVIVDELNKVTTGDRTTIRENVRMVRAQATGLWSKGIDGDPEVPLAREDRDDWDLL